MTQAEENHVTIREAAAESIEDAFRLVFGGLPPGQSEGYVEILAAEARAGRISAQGLLEARRRGRLVGALWFELQAGRAASIWPPRLTPDEPPSTAQQLLSAGCALAAQRGVCLAQALLAEVTPSDNAALRAAGFEPLAVLFYLGWEHGELPQESFQAVLDYETYDPADSVRLARLVETTYRGTLDCPQLNGLRSIEDVLAGYRSAGVFSPQRWFYARWRDRDVGCLLLADHPRENNLELVYMGLIPEARGNGWGRQICRKAQATTRQIDRARLVVAVDAENRPALTMYVSAGFQAWDRRTAYLKQLVPNAGSLG